MISLRPALALQPYVQQMWYAASAPSPHALREHVLPTGEMHLVFRLAGPALRVFDGAADQLGRVLAEPVVGGPRSAYYAKESGAPVVTVGVQLRAGAARALFGVSAAELAERHTVLSDLWGAGGRSALDQVASQADPHASLRVLETMLARRLALQAAPAVHRAVARLLAQAGEPARIDTLVRASGYSHRAFIALFREASGMCPKRYARLMRFRGLLARLRAPYPLPLGILALEAGYSDQAHMQREFRAFAGLTPAQYLRLAPAQANHVPLPEVKFVQDAPARQR